MRNPYKVCKTCAYAKVLPEYCICRRYGSTDFAMQFEDFCGFWKVKSLENGVL